MVDVRNLPHFEPAPIDYRALAGALDHYTGHDYPYMEAPWVVSSAAMNATLPAGDEATRTQYGELVGSAEQSFIELMMRGREVTKACAITPCFRLEPRYDELHHGYFIKLELIDTDATVANLRAMIEVARSLFEKYMEVEVVEMGNEMYDIVDSRHGIELGSYGFREMNERRFIYGTGLALPRLTTALQRQESPEQSAS